MTEEQIRDWIIALAPKWLTYHEMRRWILLNDLVVAGFSNSDQIRISSEIYKTVLQCLDERIILEDRFGRIVPGPEYETYLSK